MEKKVIRSGVFVKIIGIITTAIFSLVSLFLAITGNIMASICFLPFVALGILLLLAYKKERILVEEDRLTFFHLFKQPKQVKYSDIRCLLLVPLGSRTQMVLVDRQYNRLVTLDYALADLGILFEALLQNDIPSVDLGEMTEKGENVSQYINALNVMEKNHYRSIADETKTMEILSEGNGPFHIAGAKKFLKAAGWILILLNAAAFLAGGKPMVAIFLFVLLAAYGIYLWYYPYIYIETTTKKGEQNALQMPVLGPVIAMLLCLSVSKSFDYDLGSLLRITIYLTALLSIPYIIRSAGAKVPQRLSRKLSVILAVLVISFTATFPLNFLLTFDKSAHETISVTDKDISTSGSTTDYYLYGNWHGEQTKFKTSRSVYNNTAIGDTRRICLRKSALGLKYHTIHQ